MEFAIWGQSTLTGLSTGAVYALLASGLTLAYAVTRQLHLTHGDFLAIALYISLVLSTAVALDPYVTLLVTAPLLFVVGLLIFRLIVQPLLSVTPLIAFQVYLGLIWVLENALLNVFKATPMAIRSFIALDRVHFGAALALPLPQVIAVALSLIIGGGFYLLLNRTDFGRAVRAIALDDEAASLMGIDVNRVRMLTFGLAFVLIAVAAALVAPTWRVQPALGLDVTLFALIVVVVGGMGNFVGALVAGLIIGALYSISSVLFGSTLALTIPYLAFLLILALRPQGLLRGV